MIKANAMIPRTTKMAQSIGASSLGSFGLDHVVFDVAVRVEEAGHHRAQHGDGTDDDSEPSGVVFGADVEQNPGATRRDHDARDHGERSEKAHDSSIGD